MPSLPVLLIVALLGLSGPADADAQVITGRVVEPGVEEGTTLPVGGAAIEVRNARDVEVGSGIADPDGEFRISLDSAEGPLTVRVTGLFHDPSFVGPLDPPDSESLDVGAVELAPFTLAAVVVEGERRGLLPGRERVRQNQLLGRGIFLAGAQIAADDPWSLAYYLSLRSKLWTQFIPRSGGVHVLTLPPGDTCRNVAVMVNRWPIERTGFYSIDTIPLDRIAAVEIYEHYRDLPPYYFYYEPTHRSSCGGIVNVWLWNSW